MSAAVTHDVLILGAGPAGSAAAITAASRGLSAGLFDRRRFPRDKLCGGGLTGRAMALHDRIFGGPPDPGLYTSRTRFAFHAHGTPLWEVDDAPAMHMTMRTDWDAALRDRALAAGAEDHCGQRVQSVDPAARTITLACGRVLRGRALIGADGVNSAVARALFGRAHDPATVGFGLEIEGPPLDPAAPIRIDFGAADWGYGWVFPKPGSATIGVGGLHARNADMAERMRDYMRAVGTDTGARVKGHFLPFGTFRPIPGRGATLLAGDAAGLVDPITGEGIAYAMQSGAVAAEAVHRALAHGAPDTALARYRRAIAPIHRNLRHARRIRPILFHNALRGGFIRAFGASQTMKWDYLRMLAGECEYDQIVRRLILRSPRYAGRALRGLVSG